MRKWAIIAGLFLSGILSAEEGGDYRQLPFNPADPLCSVSIANIIQDSHGYIWFGTQDGLDRYDGYETLHIKMPSDCAGYGNVRSLCEDDENNIWIGSFKGICVWEAKTQRIRKYSEGAIANMVKSGDGAIWVAANYAGFLRIDPVTGNCDTLSFQYHNASAHYGEYVCYDGDRTLWFLNGVGAIYKCDIDSREMEMVFPHWNSPLAGIVTRIFWIDGYLCGGRINRGSFLYDTLSGEMTSEQWGTVFWAWNRLKEYGTQVATEYHQKDIYAVAAKNQEGKIRLLVVRYNDNNNVYKDKIMYVPMPEGASSPLCMLSDSNHMNTAYPFPITDIGIKLTLQPNSFVYIEL